MRRRPFPGARVRGYEPMRKRHLFGTAMLLGALSLAACSSGSGDSSGPTTAPVDCTGWSKAAPGATPPAAAAARRAADACLRLNQVQVVGTHNSYHFRD